MRNISDRILVYELSQFLLSGYQNIKYQSKCYDRMKFWTFRGLSISNFYFLSTVQRGGGLVGNGFLCDGEHQRLAFKRVIFIDKEKIDLITASIYSQTISSSYRRFLFIINLKSICIYFYPT